jgi:hypothetical protein
MLAEKLHTRIPMYGIRRRIIAVREDSRLRDVLWQEVFEPHLPINRRPCLLPVAVEAMNSDNTSKKVFQNMKIR